MRSTYSHARTSRDCTCACLHAFSSTLQTRVILYKRANDYRRLTLQVTEWIEGVLGIKLDSPLQQALRSGQVLCSLINALKPGQIKKIHAKSLAPMQRENIGWFLEGVSSCYNVVGRPGVCGITASPFVGAL